MPSEGTALQVLGLAGWEWILVVLAILLLFGAKKLPELARALGRALGEFQRGRAEMEKELREATTTPPAAPETEELTDRDRLLRTASWLGIPIEGKTDEELKRLIKENLKI